MTEPIGLGGSEDRQNTGTVWSPRSCKQVWNRWFLHLWYFAHWLLMVGCWSLSPEFYHFQFDSVDPWIQLPPWNPTPCFYSAQRECRDDAGEPREMLTLSRRTSGLLPHWGLSRLARGHWAPMEGRPHVRQGELVFFHLACVWLQERWW